MKFRPVTKLAVAIAITGGLAIGSVAPAYAIGSEAAAISDSGTIADAGISSEVVLANADSLRNEGGSLEAAKAANGGSTQSLGALLAMVGSLLVKSMETTMN